MISPSREDLAPFEGFKAADFAAWLKVGLEAYLIEDEGVWGFEHVAVFLQGEEHLALALGHIYRELSAPERAEFRKAVAKVMATLEADPVNAPVFEHLLAIAAVLPAPEVLSVLPVRIGNGFFGDMDMEGGRSLFEETMDAVIDLAAPTEESRACLEMLIGSPNFNIAYSGLALITLCRVAPRDFVAHMDLLRAPLAKMFEQFRTDEETKKRLAERIALAVTPAVLAKNLSKLCLSERGRGDARDMWLFRHIVDINEQNVPVVGSFKISDGPSNERIGGLFRHIVDINEQIAYSDLALMTLCRVAPRDFFAHMDLLRTPLAKMFEQFRTDEETKKRLAERIALAVTTAVLAENLPKLCLSELGRGDAEDIWLFPHIGVDISERNVPAVRSLSEPLVTSKILYGPSKARVGGKRMGWTSVVEASPRITDFSDQVNPQRKAEEVELSPFINQINQQWKAKEVEFSLFTDNTYKAVELLPRFKAGVMHNARQDPRRSRHEHAQHA